MAVALKPVLNDQEPEFDRESTPEIKLMTAMLARAIMDLGPIAPRHERRDALVWFEGRRQQKDDITFELVVETLQLSNRALELISQTMKEAEQLEIVTRRIELAEEEKNKQLPERKTRREGISKLVKAAWDLERQANPTIRRTQRWPFGRYSTR